METQNKNDIHVSFTLIKGKIEASFKLGYVFNKSKVLLSVGELKYAQQRANTISSEENCIISIWENHYNTRLGCITYLNLIGFYNYNKS